MALQIAIELSILSFIIPSIKCCLCETPNGGVNQSAFSLSGCRTFQVLSYHSLIPFVVFRFLASEDSCETIAYSFRTHKSTVCSIIREVCNSIWKTLSPEYMPKPTKDSWKQIANDYAQRWQFPNCVRSIDGKHVFLQAPAHSGSLFYNYQKA